MKARFDAGALRFGWIVLAGFVTAGLAAGPARAEGARAPGGRSTAVEGRDVTPVALQVGPHRFLIPRNHFLHPPHHSGVDEGFLPRALMPDTAPITDANRSVSPISSATEEEEGRNARER
jgi:hypothetical protein